MSEAQIHDKKPKVIQSEGRAIIASVYHFLQEEYNFMKASNFDNCDLTPLAKIRKRTAEATAVSESTVSKILKEEEEELPSTSGKIRNRKRKVIQSEGRAIIASVFHFLQEEYNFMKANNFDNCDLTPLAKLRKRTGEATGVSENTVSKVLKEEKELPSTSGKFPSPMKNRRKRESKFAIDYLKTYVIRSTIQNYHIEHKETPTMVKLQSLLKEKLTLEGSYNTFRNLLIKMGYKWQKFGNRRKVLQERQDLQLQRIQYLSKIRQFRLEGRPIIYTDDFPFLKNMQTGTRFIIMHAGTKDGFIKNAILMYKANSTIGDYHSNMTHEDYRTWLNEKLLPNLPEKAVIVMENASYQNIHSSKIPSLISKKRDMQEWLSENNIPYEESSHKIELYDLITKNTFQIDDVIRYEGFDVLRLPPNHSELNAIKYIWEILKNLIDSKNTDQDMIVVEHLMQECLNNIDNKNTWSDIIEQVEKKEIEYMEYFNYDFNVKDTVDDSDESASEDNDSLLEDD